MPIGTLLTIGSAAVSVIKADIARKEAEGQKLDAMSEAIKYSMVDKAIEDKRYDEVYNAYKQETDEGLKQYMKNKLDIVGYVVGTSFVSGVTKGIASLKEGLTAKLESEGIEIYKKSTAGTSQTDTSKITGGVTDIAGTIQKYWYVPVLAIGLFLVVPAFNGKKLKLKL